MTDKDSPAVDKTDLPLKVLIVDDLLQARRVLRSLLSKLGIDEVTEAEGVAKALATVKDQPVDLVIADLNLKDGSGLNLIEKLRAEDATKTLPVIIITSDANREDILHGAQIGISGFLLKPFDKNLLLEKIEAALGE